jgi:hypothetical protein
VAFGVSAVQVLPSLEFMSLSDRAENTYQFATYCSFPPQNFFTFLVPKIELSSLEHDWEFGGYIGVFALILAGIGAVFSKHSLHKRCFGIILLIAVTIMLGSFTPVYRLYYKFLPGIATFRIPARCLIMFVFAMSVFTGFGLQNVCESSPTKKQHIFAMTWLVVLFLCLFTGAIIFQVTPAPKEMGLAGGFFVVAFIVLNLNYFLKSKPAIAGLIIAALFVELYLTYFPRIPRMNQDEVLQKRPYELLFGKDPGFYRVASVFNATFGANYHYYDINGCTPVALGHYFRFIHEMANLPVPRERKHTLNAALFCPDTVFSSKILGIKYAIISVEYKEGYVELMTAPQVMPRAVLVKDAIVLPRLEEHLQRIKRPDFNPWRQVLLESLPNQNEQPTPKITEPLPKENNVTITKYQPNRIELQSVSDSDTYLVLSELFYPGWHAYVDDNKVQILRADYLLRAIPLTAGRHNIVFVYRPASFLAGAALTLLTLLVFIPYLFKNEAPRLCTRGLLRRRVKNKS